jgi:hypothetical protein
MNRLLVFRRIVASQDPLAAVDQEW